MLLLKSDLKPDEYLSIRENMDTIVSCVKSNADTDHMTRLGLEHNSFKTSCGSEVFAYYRDVCSSIINKTILILMHGYPETSFMWRHVIPLLPKNVPLFIPDIPGYGKSTPSKAGHDKRTIGRSVLEALRALMASTSKQAIILGGHDRGARLCHRLAVDKKDCFANFLIRGIFLLDIVPTLVQWQTFSDSKVSMGSFHWPLLANVPLATAMIKAQGGDVWCRTMMERWSGKDQSGLESLQAHGAIDIYCQYMSHDSIIRASCEDYRAGAEEDIILQKQDQELGRKLAVDTMVLYSADYLGSRYDVEAVWHQWSENISIVSVQGIGGGIGHFIAEENPEDTASAISSFWQRLNGKIQVD